MNARQTINPGRAVSLGTLQVGAVYRAPSGRLCTLLPKVKRGAIWMPPSTDQRSFAFAYLARPWVPPLTELLVAESFVLAPGNVALLREVLP